MPKMKTTIYGIYNILQIQEKFGLDVTDGLKNLISQIETRIIIDYSAQFPANTQLARVTISKTL